METYETTPTPPTDLPSRDAIALIYAPMWEEGWPRDLAVGDGWLPLLGRLGEQLREITPMPRLLQVKEKFGGARIYTEGPPVPEVEALIRAAEEEAARTCENCGQPGVLRVRNYWYRTLCADDAGTEYVVLEDDEE